MTGCAHDRSRRDAEPAAPPPPPHRRSPPVPPRDADLERLEAEARYRRDRFNFYPAHVVSGSSVPTSATRLRELERTATAAAERLAHARSSRQRSRS